MRAYLRQHRRLQALYLLLFLLIPGIYIGIFVQNTLMQYNQLVEFSMINKPDPNTFQSANYTRLSEMAEFYDTRYEQFHIPLNLSCDAWFTDANCSEVKWYVFSDNTGQYTGLAITGWVMKYIAGIQEGNATLKANALRVIRKLLSGMSMLLAVPNGGLGPEYGGILARGWAGPEQRNLPNVEWYFTSAEGQHHNGSGIYSQYRWRAYTSNDEYSGFYAGLSFIYKYVQEPDVQTLVCLMIDQIVQYMLDTNFIGIDANGSPTGVDQKARGFQGGTWVCLLLKLGALAFPTKYEQLYLRYAIEEYYALMGKEGGIQETVSNYYSYAFGYHIMWALLELEPQDTFLYQIYYHNFENSLWSYTENHRNPLYNMIRLMLTYSPNQNVTMERDVEDILMRYDCPYHFPDRMLGHANLTPEHQIAPNLSNLHKFLNSTPDGGLYALVFSFLRQDLVYYSRPLTPEYRHGNIFLWERNPYIEELGGYQPDYEYAGISFSMVYWMARAYGYFPETGMRTI